MAATSPAVTTPYTMRGGLAAVKVRILLRSSGYDCTMPGDGHSGEQRQSKAPGESPGLCGLSSFDRVLPELVVQAGAPDVVLELDLARCDEARGDGAVE